MGEPSVSPEPTKGETLEAIERAWTNYDGCVDRDEVEAAIRAAYIPLVEAAREWVAARFEPLSADRDERSAQYTRNTAAEERLRAALAALPGQQQADTGRV